LKIDKADTSKLYHLNKLSSSYDNIGSYDSAMIYANSALRLSNLILKEAKDPAVKYTAQKCKGAAYNNLGNAFCDKGNFQEGLKNYSVSLKIREEINDKKGIADSYVNIGLVYSNQGDYPVALKNYFAALKIYEEVGNKNGIASSYVTIGLVYYYQGDYPEALKNYFRSLKISQEIGDQQGLGYSYNNMGGVYEAQHNYPEALKSHFEALKIRKSMNEKKGVADSYNNIAIVYDDEGNYPEALKNNFASLKIKEEIGDKPGIAGTYANLGVVYTKQKKYKEAEKYFIRARDLSKEIGYKEYLKEIYSGLTDLDYIRGDFKGAYENDKLFILYSDSLDNEETRKKTIQTQMTYDFEKKEAVADAEHRKELENRQILAEEKSRKQKIVIVFVVLGLLLVLVFAGFIFRSLRFTRKQKNIIEEQKYIVEEKQKEIIDSINYARRIQRSLLPTEKYIEKNLKRLIKG
jgi:tetratricopeptide (TPR) repeat protein